jgi:hypothetical protein
VDHAYGFVSPRAAPEVLQAVGALPDEGVRFRTEPGLDRVFWYRQRNAPLMPVTARSVVFESARVAPTDPPYGQPGDALVVLGVEGEPLLLCVSSAGSVSPASPGKPARVAPLEIAQIDLEAEQESQVPLLVDLQRRKRLANAAFRTCMVVLGLIAIPWAWANLKAGRGDRHGAANLAAFVFVVRLLIWLLHATLVPVFAMSADHLIIAIMRAFCEAAVFWVLYMALEPFVRRHWPQTLVAWSRLLRLRFFDPAVGEHVVLGVALGCLWAAAYAVEAWLPGRLGLSTRPVIVIDRGLEPLLGGRFALAALLDLLQFALYRGLAFTLLVVLVRHWVPRTGPAMVVAALVVAPMIVPRGAHPATALFVLWGLGAVLGVWIITRFGLVVVSVGLLTSSVLWTFPATADLRVWYAEVAAVPIALCAALLVGGLVAARSRPALAGPSVPTAAP